MLDERWTKLIPRSRQDANVPPCNDVIGITSAHAGTKPPVRAPPDYPPIVTRSCTLRGRPTDAPLKNAPLSRYLRSKTLSMYSCGRMSARPAANAYPALALTMKLGSTCVDLLKSKRPVP